MRNRSHTTYSRRFAKSSPSRQGRIAAAWAQAEFLGIDRPLPCSPPMTLLIDMTIIQDSSVTGDPRRRARMRVCDALVVGMDLALIGSY